MDRRPDAPHSTVNNPGPRPEVISPAQLSWRGQQPWADAFQDIYHAEDGVGEVHRVFIEPSRLADRAARCSELLIGELGFGTGLNFAIAAELCLQRSTRLHFVSFDTAPIAGPEFTDLCSARAHQHPIYAELGACYPPLIRGWHRRHLAGGRITLSVFWGDASDGLEDISPRQRRPFDAWFLDGFAPDRNPAMWTPELLSQIGALCSNGSSIATYSAAVRVRQALESAGFSIRRIDQRPHKHESLAGVYDGAHDPSWSMPREVDVIGAGLAGASAARHLAELGTHVQVFEAAERPASGASGIPATMLHPRLLGDGSVQAALRCHAFLYSNAYCATHLQEPASGALQLPGKTADLGRLVKIAERYTPSGDWLELLSGEAAAEKARWNIQTPALWIPDARVIDTPGLCTGLLDHPNITLHCRSPVAQSARASAISRPTVLACGVECRGFAEASYLEIAPVHGQIDIVRASSAPTLPLLGNGYLVPREHDLLIGSTYEYNPWSPEEATVANLTQLEDGGHSSHWLARARATRCVSSDRAPIAGRLFDSDRGALSNRYVSTAHGSMGNVFSHYAGALVAAQICGEFAPMTRELEAAMSSERFRIRQARRGFRLGAQAHKPDAPS